MATDGVKIIDGDYAHDVYHIFMDLYDAQKPLVEIKEEVEQLRAGNDALDNEIFITTYALALWEIGKLTPATLHEVKQAIELGAFATYLADEQDVKMANQRRQVLTRFWNKISQPNLRPRRPKNYKPQRKFVFEPGDVLAFKLPEDEVYCVTILLFTSQHRGRCDYYFIVHDYVGEHKPSMADVLAGNVFGGPMYRSMPDSGLGFYSTGVGHKHLLKFADKFERLGQLPLAEKAKRLSAQGGAIDFPSFATTFHYLQIGNIPYGASGYSLNNLL
jgi:hypothetical protein